MYPQYWLSRIGGTYQCPVKKQRLFYLDLIRAVALVCILVIHFNAAVTGYFTLPYSLDGSVKYPVTAAVK